MADERVKQDKTAPSDLPPNKAPLSTYLQYPTPAETEEGWVVLADDGDGRHERTANLSVLKQIKNFLNSSPAQTSSPSSSRQDTMESTRIDYPFYDAESDLSAPIEAEEKAIDVVPSPPLADDSDNDAESDKVEPDEVESEERETPSLEAIPFGIDATSPIDSNEAAQNSKEDLTLDFDDVYVEESALDEPQEMAQKPAEQTSPCVINANEFVNFDSIPPTPPVVEIVAKEYRAPNNTRRQSNEDRLHDDLPSTPQQEPRRPAFDSPVSEKMPIFKKFVDLMGSRNLRNRDGDDESLPSPSSSEDRGVSVELALPPNPLETEAPDLFQTSLILGCYDVQTS